VFALIVVLCVGGAAAYVLQAARRAQPGAAAPAPQPTAAPLAAPPGSQVVFRRTSMGPESGRLTVAPAGDLAAARPAGTLRCERAHMASGRGVCLEADRGVFTTYRAVLFDGSFRERASLPLAGVPSRVQVSPDGRFAGVTVFVTGHSYAMGGFSTRTSILDLETNQWLVDDLESLDVRRAGQPSHSPDFNFWGVTFTRDGRGFYATLGTGEETLLVRGDLDARTLEVLEESVECPSLSPDGKRLAFKQRSGGGADGVAWRLWVLELESRKRHPLAETRNVDDQAQWLGDDQVLYALPGEGARDAVMDQWVVPADGSGEPRLFLAEAYSAALVQN
jgi:dipeptidyl aminopeptidase/acylaminoacyl peptidase